MCILIVYVAAWHCCVVVLQLDFLAQLRLVTAKLCGDWLSLWWLWGCEAGGRATAGEGCDRHVVRRLGGRGAQKADKAVLLPEGKKKKRYWFIWISEVGSLRHDAA
jgi:hypothetical protein